MSPQKLFLISGRLIAVIDWLELAVGGDVLHLQGQLVDFRPGVPEVCFELGNRDGRRLTPIHQFLIAADTMLRQKVGGIRNAFQIFDGRPAAIACALLRLDVVLNINEQADLSVPMFRLAGRSGTSGDPGGKGFFGVVHTQRFQTGEPFLIRRSGGDIFTPLDLIALPLQAAEQFFQIGTGWQEPVDSSFQLCLIAGAVVSAEGEVTADFVREISKKYKTERLLLRGECHLNKEAADILSECGIALIGVESQSIATYDDPVTVHVSVLGQGIAALEGLVLRDVPDGKYFLFAAPIKLGGSDGSPCRAVLIDKIDTDN